MLPTCDEGPNFEPYVYKAKTPQPRLEQSALRKEVAIGATTIVTSGVLARGPAYSPFHVLFVAAISFSVTSVTRKVFEKNRFCNVCERQAQMLIRSYPYLKALLVVTAVLLIEVLPKVSLAIALGLGVMQGLTHHISVKQYYTA